MRGCDWYQRRRRAHADLVCVPRHRLALERGGRRYGRATPPSPRAPPPDRTCTGPRGRRKIDPAFSRVPPLRRRRPSRRRLSRIARAAVIGSHLSPRASGCHRHRARRPSRIRRRGQRRRVAQLPAAGRRLSAAGSRPAWRHCGARPRVGRPGYARTRRVTTSATAVSVTGVSVVSVVVLIVSALRDVPLRRQTRSAHGSCGGGPARQEMFRFRRRTAAAPRLPGSAARTPSGSVRSTA